MEVLNSGSTSEKSSRQKKGLLGRMGLEQLIHSQETKDGPQDPSGRGDRASLSRTPVRVAGAVFGTGRHGAGVSAPGAAWEHGLRSCAAFDGAVLHGRSLLPGPRAVARGVVPTVAGKG